FAIMGFMANKDIEKIIEKVQSDSDKKTERYLGILQEQTKDGFKIVKEGMDGINQRLDVMQSDINVMKNNLVQKVDRYEFESLVSRVSIVERKVMP
ncbi:MAG: hypothetical protein AAB672_01055, partial [Patescibacteria group bacterium]